MVLEFVLEPCPRRFVILPLIENLVNAGGERDEAKQMLAEEPFALFRPAFSEEAPPLAVSVIAPSFSSANWSMCKAAATEGK